MKTAKKVWPKAILVDEWWEKMEDVPQRAFWAEENEPTYYIPLRKDCRECRMFPHSIALQLGLIRELTDDEEPT